MNVSQIDVWSIMGVAAKKSVRGLREFNLNLNLNLIQNNKQFIVRWSMFPPKSFDQSGRRTRVYTLDRA